ncbi:hypothetical protein AB4Y64_10690 [Lysobacter sp. TAF61]|uniref:hypothetical protein n=1 Tax=Lysobacter sp. TAF61 TaxID=3233072 RepID=UPI003F9D7CF5
MRELTVEEATRVGGAMSGQCIAEAGPNYVVTGAAIAVTISSFGVGIGALAGSALGWSGWWRDCGPRSMNYGATQEV